MGRAEPWLISIRRVRGPGEDIRRSFGEGRSLPQRLLRGFLKHPVLAVLLIALLARLVAAVTSHVLTDGYLIPDEALYVDLGRAVVVHGVTPDQWYPGYGQSFYDSTRTFSAPLLLLFEVLGASRLVGQLFAAVVGAAAAGVTVAIAMRFLTSGFAALAGLVVALTPSAVLFSSVVLREAHVWLGLTVVAGGALLLSSTDWRRLAGGLALVVVGLFALAFLRQQTLLAAAWALALALIFTPRRLWLPRVTAGVAVAALVPAVAGVGVAGRDLVSSAAPHLDDTRQTLAVGADSAFKPPPSTPNKTPTHGTEAGIAARNTAPGQQDGKGSAANTAPDRTADKGSAAKPAPGPTADKGSAAKPPPDQTADKGSAAKPAPGQAAEAGAGGASIAARAAANSEESVRAGLAHLPRGLINVTLRPFPWEPSVGVALLMARLETLGWYLLYALSLVGIVVALRHRAARLALQFPVLVLGMLVGIAALTQGNLGTSFRHRDQVLWVLALCAAAGLQWLVRESPWCRTPDSVDGSAFRRPPPPERGLTRADPVHDSGAPAR